MATSRIADHVGRVLGDRYRLMRPLGSGGSAHVYVAEDVSLRRRVAVKLLHPGLADDEAFQRRFQAEARVVASLRHPNIVRVYDWGHDDGAAYLVMELLEGGSLRSLLDRGHLLSPAQAAVVGADAARALDHAHRRSLVHRDIKPANLLFDEEGRVCIADFGLARALAEATWTEPSGAVLGTARYAAPEQVRGATLDGRADVYALAIVLVEAVTGLVPFASDTTLGTLMARVDQPLPVSDDLGPLAPMLREAGLPDPGERPDAGELAAALEQAAKALPAPQALPLAGPLLTGELERDADPTAMPGMPVLFDAEAEAPRDDLLVWPVPSSGALPETLDLRDSAPRVPRGASQGADPRPPGVEERARATPPQRSRRLRRLRWWFALVAGAVLVAVGLLALGRPRPVTHVVPDLQGTTRSDAQARLDPLRLHLRTGPPVFDDTRPKDQVVAQDPPPGARLREGRTVTVSLSAGPSPVPVPDLTGLTVDLATQRLLGASLELGAQTARADATVPAGTVITWSHQGEQVPKGSAVDVVVSTGKPKVAVPDVHAKSFADAQAALSAVGLTAVEDDEWNDTVPAAQVSSTNPAAGTPAVVGSPVTVTVSKGPNLVAVPNVVGKSVAVATSVIEADGLTVSEVIGSPDRPVYVTNPPVGSRIKVGSSVKLYTS